MFKINALVFRHLGNPVYVAYGIITLNSFKMSNIVKYYILLHFCVVFFNDEVNWLPLKNDYKTEQYFHRKMLLDNLFYKCYSKVSFWLKCKIAVGQYIPLYIVVILGKSIFTHCMFKLYHQNKCQARLSNISDIYFKQNEIIYKENKWLK